MAHVCVRSPYLETGKDKLNSETSISVTFIAANMEQLPTLGVALRMARESYPEPQQFSDAQPPEYRNNQLPAMDTRKGHSAILCTRRRSGNRGSGAHDPPGDSAFLCRHATERHRVCRAGYAGYLADLIRGESLNAVTTTSAIPDTSHRCGADPRQPTDPTGSARPGAAYPSGSGRSSGSTPAAFPEAHARADRTG